MSLSLGFFKVVGISVNSLSVWFNYVFLSCLKRALQKRKEEAPLYTFKRRASYTVEAAVVLPLCIFFLVFIMYFFRVLYINWNVNAVLLKTSREYAVTCTDADGDGAQIISAYATAAKRLASIDYLTQEIIGGVAGIDFSKSELDKNYIDFQVSYQLKNPISFFGKKKIKVSGRGCSRKWVGYDPNEDSEEDGYVYVTKYGKAYHESLKCNYLDLSIHVMSAKSVSHKRNSNGGKYSSCPICKGNSNSGYVFVTDYGDVYHSSLKCSGLKRLISCLRLSEAKKKYSACPKCAA